MIRNLDTALVRTFVTAADNASMTAAANALNLTQGAVSQQIKRLEDLFGCSLFERDRRGLRLTPSGEHLLGKAKRLIVLNDEIWGDMTRDAIRGRLRLGVPYDLAGAWIAPALRAYAEACPQVEISLVCASSPELTTLLAAGEVDLAVIEAPVGPTDGECLAVERLVWVGARGGAAHLKRPLPLSMISETCAFRPVILETLRDHGLAWRTVFEQGTIEATRATVEADLAVTAWLVATVPADLAILDADSGLPPLTSFAVNLHVPRHGAGAAAQEFARCLRRERARRD
ncbi:LysR family transcriptional regulator [Aliidongia dinghuensis]|uniref:LysR family transcriptional regulator n=1 Tax=Aliidongia dinghuensis TaxID=1867774 RepID=A0A8J3E1B1_9PROT|nr:LysR substrate-binding domain-containing protein [Aliidongia dinghuensis]GGF10298.1 LysR family transcriptional regulator [Aliidongia dinghuensis]